MSIDRTPAIAEDAAIEAEAKEAEQDQPADVRVVETDGREFVLVGTAHISRESADLVRHVIESRRPDCVCIELDQRRYDALTHERGFQSLDVREVIRHRQLSTLLLNLILASYQKQLGGKLGVLPGSELLEAAAVAEAQGIPIALCDRDVRVTLRRAWGSMRLWESGRFVVALLSALFERPELTEEDVRQIRQQDVGSKLIQELGASFPAIKTVLIDERDTYLTQKMLEAPGQHVVAVVGAGHVEGIARQLAAPRRADLGKLEVIPTSSRAWAWFAWSIPALILGSIAIIGWRKGAAAAGSNALFWILANGLPSMAGAIVALGHPATVITAFAAAPFTSLTPLIGVGYVAAFVQAYFRPPLVRELESVGDDVHSARRWWSSRLLRILLVFLLTTLGSAIGTWVGAAKIFSNLF